MPNEVRIEAGGATAPVTYAEAVPEVVLKYFVMEAGTVVEFLGERFVVRDPAR